jgi:hypothetical protein
MKIEIDTEAVEKRLTEMRDKITHFKRYDLGAEMSDWQVEDMDRHKPFTMRYRREGKAQTVIRPHSLYEMLRSEGVSLATPQRRHFARVVRKHLKRPVGRQYFTRLREHRHWSTRPILRAQLEHQLFNRMVELMRQKLTWA